ncbi:polysaccharide deacetylase family protein [Paenibacillus sp. NEAU-GSW1]|uniref:polysaccharide deacetylase family protein n=1 Tax=Paenibacillus sp. NEAU-GSW1 TaxID=2682486 RepID=UPI0012E0DF69|nr:polysaccharide deacetylase family protein [Paenibacillus sp. NEAU-GSW1]MUT67375.1 ChbG/HpnK family deacetylase [Paenibacillus sp. NEAU-GSW1]
MNVASALGYGSDQRLLIVNADDYGLCKSVNNGIQQLLEERAVSSATLMVPCKASKEAAQWSVNHPEYDVGIHLTLTSEWDNYRWGPVNRMDNVQSLVTSEGFFPKDCKTFELQADPEQVRVELIAQIETALSRGMNPTHADNHMGSLYGLATGRNFLPIVFDICAKYGLPFRMPRLVPAEDGQVAPPELAEQARQLGLLADSKGVVILDYLVGLPFQLQEDETYESLRADMQQLLRSLQPGVTELIIHPSLVTDELLAFHGQPEKRGMEFQLFRDKAIQRTLAEENIRMIGWRELQKLQRG